MKGHHGTVKAEVNDQQRLNAAYRHARRVLNELKRVRRLDGALAKALRAMYEVEDTLSKYAGRMEECV